MMEHVHLDQTSPKTNKDKNLWVVVHMIWKLAAQKKNVFLLYEIYLLANSTLETYALEAILMIGPSLTDWQHLLLLHSCI
jgi:hypothetical protein